MRGEGRQRRRDRRGRRALRLAVPLIAVLAVVPALTTPAAAAPDAVVNPSLEAVTGDVPDCFSRSGWGDSTATWELVPQARTGSVAQSLTVTDHVSGDRKLLVAETAACAPAVTPGARYAVSVAYTSTTSAIALTVFRHSAAGWTFWTDLTGLPASTDWAAASATTPVVPAGTDQLSFGISLSGNGTLVTDDYALAPVGGGSPSPTGAAPELTSNGGLEAGGSPPDGWFTAGWGDGTVTAAVTADAHTGSRAWSLTLAGRTAGDSKLLPLPERAPAVQPGRSYLLSVWYRSTTPAAAVTVFAHTASGWSYWTDLAALPASAAWARATATTPPVPDGVDAIAWGVSLAADGTLVTDDYSTTEVVPASPSPSASASASPSPTPTPEGPATAGRWSVLDYELPIRAIHATVLENGKVLLLAGSGNDLDQFDAGTFRAAVWDPVSGTFQTLDVPKDMFCSGHVTLPDGRVLIQGGTRSYPTTAGGADYGGLPDSWIFDPDTTTFTTADDANEGHWYPTLTALGNGDVWMAGGLKADTSGAVNTEMWDSEAEVWKGTGDVPQTWSFWGLYPHMFLLQDGRLFYSGGHVFGDGLPGTGASLYDWRTATITDVPGLRAKDLRDQAASVLLPPAQDQKVLVTGGGNIDRNDPAVALTDVVDLSRPDPAYVPGPDLPGDGKMYLNATTLPDRTVLVSNGGRFNRDDTANVMTAAVYDPAAGTWRSVAADPIGRNYHSTAVLLPDGRVAVFGSNPGDGSFEMRISVYEPGYLFRGARPVLGTVPATAGYGQQLTATVTSSAPVAHAELVRPMSVTHQMDSNMRLVDVPVTVSGGTATMTLPDDPDLLPPGPYMLTVTDADGVPSVARWVTVR